MPTTTTPPRPLLRALSAAAAALVLSLGGLLVASPASAHDELVSSDPAADTALDTMPAQIALTFSGEIATDPGATELQVTDAAGTNVADGVPVVLDNVVTQPLTGAGSGAVTVLWKVVSSDGHPISGQYAFTVTGAPTPTPTPTASVTPSPSQTTAPTEEPTPASTPEPTQASAPVESGDGALPWVIGGLVLLAAVGGAIAYLLVSRARRQRTAEDLRSAPSQGSGGGSAAGSEPPADR